MAIQEHLHPAKIEAVLRGIVQEKAEDDAVAEVGKQGKLTKEYPERGRKEGDKWR